MGSADGVEQLTDPAALVLGQMRDRHARELALPLVVGRLAHAMLPACLGDLGAQLDLLEDADYLGFAESGFLHVETPLGWILYFQVAQVFKGTSNSPKEFKNKK